MDTSETAIILTFWITNIARILAYLPQIVSICRDKGRAGSVSCATWVLFLVSNLASALYAGVIAAQVALMAAFAVNAVCCAAIVGLLCWKRAVRPVGLAGHE